MKKINFLSSFKRIESFAPSSHPSTHLAQPSSFAKSPSGQQIDHSIPSTNETKTFTYLGRGEHATTAAHVTESPLSRAVGTTPRDARNTRHRATGTPRFGRRLVPRLVEDGVRLAIVLVQPGVHGVDDIRANRGEENFRQRDGGAAALHGDDRERGWHVEDVFVPLNLRRREADARENRAIFVPLPTTDLCVHFYHPSSGKKTCV